MALGLNHAPEWPNEVQAYAHGPFGYSVSASLDYRPDNGLSVFSSVSHAYSEGIFGYGSESAPPHGSRSYIHPEFTEGALYYELALLRPYEYVVLATITDLEDPEGVYLAAGGPPDFCTFGVSPVAVLADTPTQGVDIELSDNGGGDDPGQGGLGLGRFLGAGPIPDPVDDTDLEAAGPVLGQLGDVGQGGQQDRDPCHGR